MKKTIMMAVLALFTATSVALAATSTGIFAISASIPAATKVNFIVSQVQQAGSTITFTPNGSTALNFSTAGTGLTFNTANGVYLASRFFAIDLAPATATDVPAPGNYSSITFSYGGQTVPAGQPAAKGLNEKATISAVKVEGATGAQTETPVISPRNIGGTIPSLTQADVAGGFLRVYVGLSTGQLTGGPGSAPVAPGSVPFTNADVPGPYTGTLTITATVI